MSFNRNSNNNSKSNYSKKSNNDDDLGDIKLSLWESDEDKKYILSGVLEINGERLRVFVYENQRKNNDRSPDYYGSFVRANS